MSAGLFIMVAAPQVAAATCTLTAPATVAVGTPLSITGSGFPPSTSVDMALTLTGGTPDQFTVQSDANGAFRIDLTPELQDVGTTTVVATAGTICSAQTVFTVPAPSPTPTPSPSATPSPSPSATPTPSVTPKPTTAPKPTAKPTTAPKPTATPTGGTAAGGAGGEATPPRTDAALKTVERPAGVPLAAWVLAGVILLMGVGGLVAARRVRGD